MGNHTITFTKKGLKEYKSLYDEAVKNNHQSFVHKGGLQKVNEAKKLIDRFEKEFSHPVHILAGSTQVTLPYED